MNSRVFPLQIHNCTNDDLICRYSSAHGFGDVRIGPRGKRTIQDAYEGMTIHASSGFDPNSVFATLSLASGYSDVHFTEQEGGLGKGAPVGPPAAARDHAAEQSRQRTVAINKQREAAQASLGKPTIPGDGADSHGVSLARAHASDLQNQDGSGLRPEGDAGTAPAQQSMVYVPGLGTVPADGIPPHVLRQMAMREQVRQQHMMRQEQQDPLFPNYDEQAMAFQLDDMPNLPPVMTNKGRRKWFGGLTAPERFVAAQLHSVGKLSPTKSEKYARPVFIMLLVALVGAGVWYRNRIKAPPHTRKFSRARR